VFFTTDSLDPVARRIGYLVGASTGKKGRGIVPIFGRPSYGLEMLQQGCLVVILRWLGKKTRVATLCGFWGVPQNRIPQDS
jgi:hypothetical protein